MADAVVHHGAMFDTDELVINMGPQHPSTHGVLRVVLRLDGERVQHEGLHVEVRFLFDQCLVEESRAAFERAARRERADCGQKFSPG